MDDQILKFLNKAYLLAGILILGILVFFVGQIVLQNKQIDQQNQYQFTVSGQGKVYAKPDVALLNLGVKVDGNTVADVTKSGNDKMNAVVAAIKKMGVDDKDIQTTNYNLSPVYENTIVPMTYSAMMPNIPVKSSSNLKGYSLEQDVQVKIRDFDKIGQIMSQATSIGANLISDLQFTIDNPEQFREQARAKAIAEAQENARNLAKESGIGLGKLINIYENYNPYPIYNKAMGMGGAVADSAPAAPTIQPGQQEIDVTINLTYQVK